MKKTEGKTVITMALPEDLHRQAKISAAKEGITLKAWVEKAMINQLEALNGNSRISANNPR